MSCGRDIRRLIPANANGMMNQVSTVISHLWGSLGIAPVFPLAKFVVAPLVMPDAARGPVVGGHEPVAITHAAVMRRLHLVPDDEASLGHAAGIDAHGFDLAAYHQPVDPLPGPGDLAFEMTAALGDARRTQLARRQ